ncbi:hypothetical protein DFP73DRAFT_569737 [Morchella snyderi]|nr:hypothetical protein DFP73DRAFT_569737 [Morchella snyderi]
MGGFLFALFFFFSRWTQPYAFCDLCAAAPRRQGPEAEEGKCAGCIGQQVVIEKLLSLFSEIFNWEGSSCPWPARPLGYHITKYCNKSLSPFLSPSPPLPPPSPPRIILLLVTSQRRSF